MENARALAHKLRLLVARSIFRRQATAESDDDATTRPPLASTMEKLLHRRRRRRASAYFSALLFITAFVVSSLYSRNISFFGLGDRSRDHLIDAHGPLEDGDDAAAAPPSTVPFAVGRGSEGCDIFEGRWVVDDPPTRPLYEEEDCPYIQPQLTCQAHGRSDRGYQRWRWQPSGCFLPRFNASLALEKLRGRRMLFVGDSLNRGQYVSMLCLLHRAIPDGSKSIATFDSLTVFTAKEYNATIEFYWAPMLDESNGDNPGMHRVTDRIVRANSVFGGSHSKQWVGADIIVFNSYIWWMKGPQIKILKNGSFDDGGADIVQMPTEEAYAQTLRSVVRWAEENMDPSKTRVMFVTMSPSHHWSAAWGGRPDGNCFNETEPIGDPAYWGSASKSMMRVVEEVLSPAVVDVVNITQLSEYRKDAHTQIYKQQWSPLTAEQLADPRSYADCVHWCLPGLQDTWNELLYAKLFFP